MIIEIGPPRLGVELRADDQEVGVGVAAPAVRADPISQGAHADIARQVAVEQIDDGVGRIEQRGEAGGQATLGAEDVQSHGPLEIGPNGVDVDLAGEAPELPDVGEHTTVYGSLRSRVQGSGFGVLGSGLVSRRSLLQAGAVDGHPNPEPRTPNPEPASAASAAYTAAAAMQRFALRLLATALAVLLATLLFSGSLAVAHIGGAIAFALAIGLVNAFLRPVLLLFALPLTLLTLGLFALVVNALGFWTATLVPLGLQVDGFGGAFLGALTVSAVSFLSSRALR